MRHVHSKALGRALMSQEKTCDTLGGLVALKRHSSGHLAVNRLFLRRQPVASCLTLLAKGVHNEWTRECVYAHRF